MTIDRLPTLALAASVFALACTGGEQAESPPVERDASTAAQTVAAAATAVPELTAEGVWAHLTEENDYESWATWPGKGERYGGGAPHGALLTTYLNDIAAAALASGAGGMPVGAIVAKNNYMPDGTLAAVTVMVKTADFNPDHNNWWFLKRNADGSVDAAGRFDGCEGCHGAARANDYILTGSLSAGQQ